MSFYQRKDLCWTAWDCLFFLSLCWGKKKGKGDDHRFALAGKERGGGRSITHYALPSGEGKGRKSATSMSGPDKTRRERGKGKGSRTLTFWRGGKKTASLMRVARAPRTKDEEGQRVFSFFPKRGKKTLPFRGKNKKRKQRGIIGPSRRHLPPS